MLVEATLDFPEEEIDFLRKADARGHFSKLQHMLATVMQRAQQGALLREGIKAVIAGQPNAGKSSLLNALAGAELAIVTPIAGTTRDKVQQTIQIEGVPLHVIDTAGLRDSATKWKNRHRARAWEEIAAADAVLFLHDLTRQSPARLRGRRRRHRPHLAERLPPGVPVIDVEQDRCRARRAAGQRPGLQAVRLSARTGEGLERCAAAAGGRGLAAGGRGPLHRARALRYTGRCAPSMRI